MIDREKDMALADKLCEVIKAEGNISLHDVAVAMVITQLTYGKDPIRTMNLLPIGTAVETRPGRYSYYISPKLLSDYTGISKEQL